MNELKPEDVMRALECHATDYKPPMEGVYNCKANCPYHQFDFCTTVLVRDALALLREKDARIKELEEAQGVEFTCFVGEPHKVDCCPYGDELARLRKEVAEKNTEIKGWKEVTESLHDRVEEKNAEIERLKKERDLANAEREANVKGFTEELQNTIDRYKGVIRILEQDIATRDNLIEGKVEAAYPEFMRDYKQLQEEYSDLRNEIVDRYVEMCKRAFNFGETIMEKSICDILCKVAKDLKEAHQ